MKRLHYVLALFVLMFVVGSLVPATTSAQSCCVLRGDVNDDNKVIVSDLTFLVNFLFKGGVAPTCLEHGDLNDDSKVIVSDLTYLVNFLFKSGVAPVDCPAQPNVVFVDEYGNTVSYEAFGGSKLDAVQVDLDSMYAGTAGLVITVPDVGDPSGSYAGGAFTADARDLTEFNALTFWAKASRAATLDVAGIGNDNTGLSQYTAQVGGLALTTSWQKYVIPFPLAEKLSAEAGLFFFAEGPEGGVGCQIWIDEIIFEDLATITNPRPALPVQTVEAESGNTFTVNNGSVIFDIDGTDMTVSAMPRYFTFTSSNPSIVSVGLDGTLTAGNAGTATLTAKLGLVDATGSITVNVSGPQPVPAGPAPTPTPDPADVVSLFSDAYTNVTVDTWSAGWDMADVEDYLIGADNVKKYTNLVYAGIEFTSSPVDASAMTHFHMDVWTPDATGAPAVFKIKLVDFGADGMYGGGDDVEHELTFDEATMNTGEWVSIDVPLAAFTNLVTTGHLAQMIISGDPNTLYVDNVYCYDSGIPTAPLVPAATPTPDAAYVVSLYSDAYVSGTVDTWSAVWDQADVEDYLIGSDNTKKYSNLIFAGIEFTSSPLDASAMTRFHMDVWTAQSTDAPKIFKIKLVDFGVDGVYGGGDDVEHELTFDENTMNTGSWTGIDVPLTDFTNLTTTGHLAQMIISGDLSTFWVDNIYFYTEPPTEPVGPAPTPALAAVDVVSLYSDAYTSATVDTWSAGWDMADVEDVVIGSDNAKKYTNLTFAGIEFTSVTVDASAMTHFHMDLWTPDATSAPAVFKVKLVDFGANGVWDGGGDDVEHELTFDENTMNTGEWVSIEIPISDFTGLITRGHLAQMIISGDPNTVWVDNIYFHK